MKNNKETRQEACQEGNRLRGAVGRIASFRVGYRAYQIDYMTGSDIDAFGYDATQHGPRLGVGIYF